MNESADRLKLLSATGHYTLTINDPPINPAGWNWLHVSPDTANLQKKSPAAVSRGRAWSDSRGTVRPG